MSTEAELALMSLTHEELEDAARWLGVMHDRWREDQKVHDEQHPSHVPGAERFGNGTDGPVHLIRAMHLTIQRERAQRGGAEPWYIGMPIDDHPARATLRYYQERIVLNPDEGRRPRLTAAGIVEKVCVGCKEPKPLTVRFWGLLGDTLDDWCRTCRAGKGPTAIEPEFVGVVDPDPVASL